jgi:hypothetical protein
MIDTAAIKQRLELISPVLDECARRRFAASEALAAGWGRIATVSDATGIARTTIGRGLEELRAQASGAVQGGIRRAGAGPLREIDPTLVSDLERIADPSRRGDPTSRLKWTTKSLRKLASALHAMGHRVDCDVVGEFRNSGREWLPSGSTTTRQLSQSTRSAPGGPPWDAPVMPTPIA